MSTSEATKDWHLVPPELLGSGGELATPEPVALQLIMKTYEAEGSESWTLGGRQIP